MWLKLKIEQIKQEDGISIKGTVTFGDGIDDELSTDFTFTHNKLILWSETNSISSDHQKQIQNALTLYIAGIQKVKEVIIPLIEDIPRLEE